SWGFRPAAWAGLMHAGPQVILCMGDFTMMIRCGVQSVYAATILFAVAAQDVFGATWDAGGLDPNWSMPENWIGDVAPPNDGTSDIFFVEHPPATPLLLSPQSIRSLNLIDDTWGLTLAGDLITIGEGGFNAMPPN